MKFEEIWVYAEPIVKMLLIFIVGHFLIVYLIRILKKSFTKANLDPSLSRFLTRTIRIVAYTIIALSALAAIGVSTTGMVAALSAAAVAVSVGLKDSLSNVAGGILLLISPRFATGDFIEADGDEGKVIDVDLLHTTILTYDCKQISIPNGVLINTAITNYSREQKRLLDIAFPISYDSDVNAAKKAALTVIERHPLSLKEPAEPFVRVRSYEDSSVKLVARVWCKNENYWTLYYDLIEQVREEFLKNNVTIPFNQLDVHIKNDNE